MHHLEEKNHYLTLFTFLRLSCIGAYLYFESDYRSIVEYLQDNWLAFYNRPSNNYKLMRDNLKTCVRKWTAFRLNLYSVALLLSCEFLNCFSNLWVYYFCLNFGILENLLSLLKGCTILLSVLPLCLDLSYTLLQRVNPNQLGLVVEDKIRAMQYMEGVVRVGKWHLWCLDKSYRVITIKVEVTGNANPDDIK